MGMLERYGGPAVFLGRFVAFARAFIPGLAGMSGVRYRTFLLYNAVGGVIWGVGYTMLGFVVGLSFEHIVSEVGRWSILVVAVVVVGVVAVHLLRRRRERDLVVVEVIEIVDDPAALPTEGPGEGPHPDRPE
jgi:membrane protein DedA with SNARE-associated domain